MRTIYALHDAKEGGSKAFGSLLGALNRLARERPALLGTAPQLLTGNNAPAPDSGVVGAVVGGVVGMLSGETSAPGLSSASAMKLQWCVIRCVRS